MDAPLLNFLLSVAFAAFFSCCRTYADNMDTNLTGWRLVRLYAGSLVLGAAAGVISVPVALIARALSPWPAMRDASERYAVLTIACICGWEGLPRTMGKVEKVVDWALNKFFQIEQKEALPHGSSVSDASRPRLSDADQAPGPTGDLPAGPVGPPENQQPPRK